MRIYVREIFDLEPICDCGATYSEHYREVDGQLLCPVEGDQTFLTRGIWLKNLDTIRDSDRGPTAGDELGRDPEN